MSFVHSPKIVTDGLVLSLDAGNVKSYPGSGTVWTDKSGFNNNGTLTNGPTFNSANGGSIVFDGTNDYVVINNFPNLPVGNQSRTVNIWFYTNSTTWDENVNNLFFYGTPGPVGTAFGIDFGFYPQMEIYTWGGLGKDIVFNTTFPQIGWSNILVTYDGATTIKIYENGNQTQTLLLSTSCNTGNTNVWIGSITPSYQSWYFDGRVALTHLYNRALSAQEVSQNFNALRGRFGI
jgi:hypothetical protein